MLILKVAGSIPYPGWVVLGWVCPVINYAAIDAVNSGGAMLSTAVKPAVRPEGAQQTTPERIMQFAWGYAAPLMMEAAVHHRVFDTLDGSPMTVAEMSRTTGASERGLRVLMNALAGFGLLTRDAGGRFGLAPDTARFLVSNKPGYLGGVMKHVSSQLIPRWLHLSDVVASGKPVETVDDDSHGAEFFAQFVGDLFPMNYPAAMTLAGALRLPDARPVRVLDIAAGSGVWGIALAQKSEQVRVTALDTPGVIPVTRSTVARFGLADRFDYIEGDMATAEYGTGYQVAVLGHILHALGEGDARALLRKTFAALEPGGSIAIAEFLVNDDRSGPPNALVFAVNMLVNTDAGDTYSFEQIGGWLREAGFENPRTVDAPGPSPLILAEKPGTSPAVS